MLHKYHVGVAERGRVLLFQNQVRTNRIAASTMDLFSAQNDNSRANDREAFERGQMQVSAMEPHHIVYVSYPHTACIKQPEEKLILLDIHNAAERYAPKPLTASKTVEINSGRMGQIKLTPHYLNSSVEELTECWEKVVTVQQLGKTMDDLVQAVEYAEAFVGGTFLEVTTISTPKAEGTQVLVRRYSKFHKTHGQEPAINLMNYVFPLAHFEQLRGQGKVPSWWYILDDLLYRRTDQAAQFVGRQLEERNAPDTKAHQWRSPRMIDFSLAVQAAPPGSDGTAEEELECGICSEVAEHAVTLPGCKMHRFDKACVTEWWNFQGPEKAHCPLCRRRVFEDDKQAHDLTFGLINGVYNIDFSFTPYEDFLRSCADLDERSAFNIEEPLNVDIPAMAKSWDLLMRGAALEPAVSRPHFLQPARMSEMSSVHHGLKKAFRLIDNCATTDPNKCTVKRAAAVIYKEIQRSLTDEASASSFMEYIRQEKISPYNIVEQNLRSGQEVFLKVNVSRMLMMVRVRKCSEHGPGWHKHGLRDYYREPSHWMAG